MRGTQRHAGLNKSLGRFIPAGAGNTTGRDTKRSAIAVYPRCRGEHVLFFAGRNEFVGLSPLARGTRKVSILRQPAISVYPRWRGEHHNSLVTKSKSRGLSPLARGTLRLAVKSGWCCRFIPAGAGNTAVNIASITISAVYPRWRGEHTRAADYVIPDRGLSPLARGTHKCLRP